MSKDSETENKNKTEEDILSIAGIGPDEGDDDDASGSEDTGEEDKSGKKSDGSDTGEGGDIDNPLKQTKETKGKGADPTNKGGQPIKKNGQVLAQPGAERRVFEDMKKRLREYDRDMPQMKARLQAYEAASNFKEFGLSPEQAINSFKLMKAYIEKPSETIKWMLTQAQANGIKIDLGGGGAGLDPAAIKQMISEAMAPITQASDARKKEIEVRTAAEEEYHSFIDRYPDVKPHEDAIAGLLDKDPSLSLDGAYWRLRAFFNENGLDFSKPLAHHAAALRAKNGGKGGEGRRPPHMPSGRGHFGGQGGGDDVEGADERQFAPVNADYSDIIRSAMRERGLGKR